MDQNFSKIDSTTLTMNGSNSSIPTSRSGSRVPEETTPIVYPCGYCDIHCIYHAIYCVFTVGIIANAIVLFRVALDRKLRKVTFVSIASCAFADMCFLVISLAVSFEAVIWTTTCNYYTSVSVHNVYKVMKIVSYFSANGHVALLAIVRYVFLTFPLKASIYLRTRRVLLLSGLVWALGFLFIITMTLISITAGIERRRSEYFQIILWTAIYLIPVIVTASLHIVKIYKLKHMSFVNPSEQMKGRIKKMSKMVAVVIVCATVMPLPFVLNRLLQSVELELHVYGSTAVALHAGYIVQIFMLLNHSVNPVIYAFVSDAFRMSLKRMLGRKKHGLSSTDTPPSAPLSVIQRREELLNRMTD